MHHLTDETNSPQISITALVGIVGDIGLQPTWRAEADRAADYYDGKQYTPAERAEMEERGQPVLIHNLIQPTINGVLGLEAKTRTDWKLLADDEQGLEVAEGLNEKLLEAARISRADRACADAYGAEIKVGLGWVEVTRDPDPFAYPYQVNYIHRREIWWDMHSQKPDLSDARWLLRKRELDIDEITSAFPDHKELIEAVSNGWGGLTGILNEDETQLNSEILESAYQTHTESGIHEADWWDPERKRAWVTELWYRVWTKKPVLLYQNGDAVEYDEKNVRHVVDLARGRCNVEVRSFPKMRLAFFVGPHRLADLDSPHPHNKFPYVPFWGYREDRTGVPYGIVRGMMPAQDEINKRRSKLTWLLNAKLIIKDDDSVLDMSDDELMEAALSGDGVITLNQNRKNKDHNAFRLVTDLGVAQQQFSVMQDAMKQVQDCAGVYSAFLGQEGGAKSGVAIDSLVEQGTTTLAEINDNYRFARQSVGELLLAHIVQDIGEAETEVRINVNGPQRTKVIKLNARHEDGGNTQIHNRVMQTKTRVVLSDVQSTPGYRQQMAQGLMDMAASLPPEYSAALIDLIAELMDVPNREEVLKRIRQVSGMGMNPEDMSEEEQAAFQREQEIKQLAQEMEMEAKKLQLEDMAAKIRELNAKSAKMESLTPVEQEKLAVEIQKLKADIKETATDIAQKRKNLYTNLSDQAAYEQKRLPPGARKDIAA